VTVPLPTCGVLLTSLKSKEGRTLAKDASLLINLNLDGTSIRGNGRREMISGLTIFEILVLQIVNLKK
jgi:hypothetical protein